MLRAECKSWEQKFSAIQKERINEIDLAKRELKEKQELYAGLDSYLMRSGGSRGLTSSTSDLSLDYEKVGNYSITRVTYSNFKTLPEAEQGVTLSLSFSCVWYLSLLSVCSVEQRQLLPHSVWLHWSVWTNEESCRSQPSPGRHWEVQDTGGDHGGPGVSKRQGQRGGQEAFNLERGAPGELGKS